MDWIRSQPATSHIPVIRKRSIPVSPSGTYEHAFHSTHCVVFFLFVSVMCADLPLQASERLVRRGATEVLHKPLNKTIFLNTILSILNSRYMAKSADQFKSQGDEIKEQLLKEHHRNIVIKTAPGGENNSKHVEGQEGTRMAAPSRTTTLVESEPVNVVWIAETDETWEKIKQWAITLSVTGNTKRPYHSKCHVHCPLAFQLSHSTRLSFVFLFFPSCSC